MGLGDFVEKAKEVAAENKEQVEEGIDKAANVIDDKTGAKYSDQIEDGADKAKEYVEDLEEEDD